MSCVVEGSYKCLPLVIPCRHFSTVDAVLHGARHMVAMQIASDPTVRQVLRRAFRERAILSVRPTKKGKKVFEYIKTNLDNVCQRESRFKYLHTWVVEPK